METPTDLKTENKEEKICFVIMPIADTEGYDIGHFNRVYEYIIKPAVTRAGFEPLRADEVKATNFIIVDILKQIVSADMCVCDLSSKNANVLYELGIRQAFNLPVCLIKDTVTKRMFDIQGFRDVEYDEKLRIDNVNQVVEELADTIKNTYEVKGKDINSIIQLLGINPAEIKNTTELSKETSILLNAINNINQKVGTLEREFIKEKINYNFINNEYNNDSSWIRTDYGVGDKVVLDDGREGKVIKNSKNKNYFTIDFGDDEYKMIKANNIKLKVVE